MFRVDSRITLEVTDVWVQLLNEITDADAQAEGIFQVQGDRFGWSHEVKEETYERHSRPTQAFRTLWNSINAKRGYGWDVNPWVWAINFKRIKP